MLSVFLKAQESQLLFESGEKVTKLNGAEG
jgi:hypothetical protein